MYTNATSNNVRDWALTLQPYLPVPITVPSSLQPLKITAGFHPRLVLHCTQAACLEYQVWLMGL